MDSTFLASDKSIPAGNMSALDLLARRRWGFVPCTGRALGAMPRELLSHSSVHLAISCNGAMVSDVRAGTSLRQALMGEERTLALWEALRDVDCTFDVFADGLSMADGERFSRIGRYGIDGQNERWLRVTRTVLDQRTDDIIRNHPNVEKVTLYLGSDEARSAVRAAVARIPGLRCTSSHPNNLEVGDERATKGEALLWVCSHEGVDPHDVVAFGDSPDDLPMIEAAGDGVAVANAVPQVLRAADHVCGTNDEAGVGAYLEALLA
jgi:HAD superfamily hydrolase (TIGR01484 family)